MIKHLTGCTISVLLALSIVACSSDDDDPSDSGETSTPTDSNGGGPTINTAFDGTWTQGCTADDPEDPETEYETTTLTIAGDVSTANVQFFSDSECQTPSTGFQTGTITSSIVYPGAVTTTTQGDATHIDVTVESLLLDGEPPPEALAAFSPVGEITYDLALIEGDTLYAGDDSGEFDGSTAALRPTQLDTANTFTRQQ